MVIKKVISLQPLSTESSGWMRSKDGWNKK